MSAICGNFVREAGGGGGGGRKKFVFQYLCLRMRARAAPPACMPAICVRVPYHLPRTRPPPPEHGTAASAGRSAVVPVLRSMREVLRKNASDCAIARARGAAEPSFHPHSSSTTPSSLLASFSPPNSLSLPDSIFTRFLAYFPVNTPSISPQLLSY